MKKNLFIAFLVSFMVLATSVLYLIASSPQTAYVDVVQLYEGFRLKSELESQLTQFESDTRYLMDSMQMEIQMIAEDIQQSESARLKLEKLQKETLIKQQQIESDYQEMVEHFDDQIWIQLNQYIKDFTSEEGYDFLLGANGNGTVLAGNPSYDVTKELINYANDRYHGMAK